MNQIWTINRDTYVKSLAISILRIDRRNKIAKLLEKSARNIRYPSLLSLSFELRIVLFVFSAKRVQPIIYPLGQDFQHLSFSIDFSKVKKKKRRYARGRKWNESRPVTGIHFTNDTFIGPMKMMYPPIWISMSKSTGGTVFEWLPNARSPTFWPG